MITPTKNKLYYVALFMAVIFGAYNFWPSGENPQQPAELPTVSPSEVEKAAYQTAAKPVDLAAQEELPWGDSPFRHKSAPAAAPTGDLRWVLSGIIYSAKTPVAIINQKTISVGSTVDLARVKEIRKDAVILEYNGFEFTLTVSKG